MAESWTKSNALSIPIKLSISSLKVCFRSFFIDFSSSHPRLEVQNKSNKGFLDSVFPSHPENFSLKYVSLRYEDCGCESCIAVSQHPKASAAESTYLCVPSREQGCTRKSQLQLDSIVAFFFQRAVRESKHLFYRSIILDVGVWFGKWSRGAVVLRGDFENSHIPFSWWEKKLLRFFSIFFCVVEFIKTPFFYEFIDLRGRKNSVVSISSAVMQVRKKPWSSDQGRENKSKQRWKRGSKWESNCISGWNRIATKNERGFGRKFVPFYSLHKLEIHPHS